MTVGVTLKLISQNKKSIKAVPITCALSSSYSKHPVPSNLCRSTQPRHITHTPFNMNCDFKCTCKTFKMSL